MADPIKKKQENVTETMSFFMLVGQIKKAQRTGWTHHNIEKVESVSDHMYRMAIMTMLLDAKHLDTTHCMKIAVVHDLAECIVGDITPFCGISPEEKHQREKDAMVQLTDLIHNKQVASDIMDLWEEYSTQKTDEAKAVKDIDRFEMILQAFEYEKAEDKPGNLQTFFDSTAGKFRHGQIQNWVEELNKQRFMHISNSEKVVKDGTVK